MAKRSRMRKCINCNELFLPDHRNRKRQEYCSSPECRAASKKASNDRWRHKKENLDYFSGPQQVARVQDWRKRNPGYSSSRQKKSKPLQDSLNATSPTRQGDKANLSKTALQDYLSRQSPIIIGLIANLTEKTLQDDIAQTITRMGQLGRDIINDDITAGKHNCSTHQNGGSYDNKAAHQPTAHSQGTG